MNLSSSFIPKLTYFAIVQSSYHEIFHTTHIISTQNIKILKFKQNLSVEHGKKTPSISRIGFDELIELFGGWFLSSELFVSDHLASHSRQHGDRTEAADKCIKKSECDFLTK